MRHPRVLMAAGVLLFCIATQTAAQDAGTTSIQLTPPEAGVLASHAIPFAEWLFNTAPPLDAGAGQLPTECEAQTEESSPCTPGFGVLLQVSRPTFTATVGVGALGPAGVVFGISDEALREFYASRDREAEGR